MKKMDIVLLGSIVILLNAYVFSCSSAQPNINPPPTARSVVVFVSSAEGISEGYKLAGFAPFVVFASPFAMNGSGDPKLSEAFVKLEINMGDGSGWIDFTDEYRAYLALGSQPDGVDAADYHLQHTYQAAGEYTVQARAQYWDGQLIYSGAIPTYNPIVVVQPAEPQDGQPSGEEGFDEEDEWVIRDFTDARDGRTYEIIDGRALVAFFMPVDMDSAWQFVADENLDVLSEWWMIGAISVLLPPGTSVEEAVGDWPDEYPELIESVAPDAVVEAD